MCVRERERERERERAFESIPKVISDTGAWHSGAADITWGVCVCVGCVCVCMWVPSWLDPPGWPFPVLCAPSPHPAGRNAPGGDDEDLWLTLHTHGSNLTGAFTGSWRTCVPCLRARIFVLI